MNFLKNKVILVTGGTGTFGKEITKFILDNTKVKKLIIFSRDENKQFEMSKQFFFHKQIRFFIGDVRDEGRLMTAFRGVDYVIHAAAMKHVLVFSRRVGGCTGAPAPTFCLFLWLVGLLRFVLLCCL